MFGLVFHRNMRTNTQHESQVHVGQNIKLLLLYDNQIWTVSYNKTQSTTIVLGEKIVIIDCIVFACKISSNHVHYPEKIIINCS